MVNALTVLGGLGVFLFGLRIFSSGLQMMAGNRLRGILAGLTRNRLTGVLTGFFVTCAVQSSSATTVLIVSFANAGLLTLVQAMGLVMGANIGTTVTALLAATVTNQAGMTIAFVHFLFNSSAAALFLPIPALRRLPLSCAHRLANAAARNRIWVLIYLGTVFVVIPLLGILIWKR